MNLKIFGHTFRAEILLAIVVLYWVVCGFTLSCCSRVTAAEGFAVAKKAVKEGFSTGTKFSDTYGPAHEPIPDVSAWTYSGADPKVMATYHSAPLPADEMNMFANTKFSPECCPSSYSNSSGCACIDASQYKMLEERGGNSTHYSEY